MFKQIVILDLYPIHANKLWKKMFIRSFSDYDITWSTHFNEGPFNLPICFLTTASNAMSGVNKPVLKK
jgi:hypothetical protein